MESDLIERLNDPARRLTVSDRQEAAIEIEKLRAYALHMQARYQAYRDHHGTTGTYPHPDSVALLEAALG